MRLEPFVRKTEKAIITIYPGKMTDEERRRVLEEAAQRFYKAIQRKEREEVGA